LDDNIDMLGTSVKLFVVYIWISQRIDQEDLIVTLCILWGIYQHFGRTYCKCFRNKTAMKNISFSFETEVADVSDTLHFLRHTQGTCFANRYNWKLEDCFFLSNAPTCLCGLRGPPSWYSRSVTDFWGWDAHEARLRCSDDVSGDIGGCSAKRALKPKFYQPTQIMVIAGILPFRGKFPRLSRESNPRPRD